MKSLAILIIFLFFNSNQEKLYGKFKIEYEDRFKSQNGIVIFKGSIYERHLKNGKVVKGKIKYKKFSIELEDVGTNLEMDFYKGDIDKDTIFFSTRDLNNKAVTNNDIVINSGKLIRLKKEISQ